MLDLYIHSILLEYIYTHMPAGMLFYVFYKLLYSLSLSLSHSDLGIWFRFRATCWAVQWWRRIFVHAFEQKTNPNLGQQLCNNPPTTYRHSLLCVFLSSYNLAGPRSLSPLTEYTQIGDDIFELVAVVVFFRAVSMLLHTITSGMAHDISWASSWNNNPSKGKK